ncbi:hypothetical protein [Streptomyces sp. NPDC054866]
MHDVQALLSDEGRATVLTRAVAAASESELHAAFLHACEWDIATGICDRLAAHCDDVTAVKHDAEQRVRTHSGSVLHPATRHIDEVAVDAARTLAHALQGEAAEAIAAVKEAAGVRSLIDRCGRESKFAPAVPLPDVHRPSPLETLGAFQHQLHASNSRVDDLRAEDRRILHELALEEELRRQAADASEGFALKDIDLNFGDDFYDVVADLADGDPHPVSGYDGRDQPVTATLSDGRPAVLFTKHLPVVGHATYTTPPLPAIELPDVHQLSELGRHHFPGAAIIVVTNARFTRPAHRYARTNDVQLLGREGLERWATWSAPLYSVLGSCEAHADTETTS